MYSASTYYLPHKDGLDDPILDKTFSYEELVLSVASLTENKAPGADYILSNDLTILLHVDESDHRFAEDNAYILKYILNVFNSLWRDEKVSPIFKQTILRPILKKADSDLTDLQTSDPYHF